jgi:uncharacterized membrane protein YedE/YeeE
MSTTSISTYVKPLGPQALPLAVGLAILLASARLAPILGFWWAMGLGMGFAIQRGRLCFAASFRDLFVNGRGELMRAVLLGLMVATVAFAALMARMVPDPSMGDLAPKVHVWSLGANVLVGGLLFGAGMVLAGGCVSGTLWRIGEGYVGSLVALGGILMGLEGATLSWNWWWRSSMSKAPRIWLPQVLGHMGAWIAVVAALAGLYLLTYWWEARRAGPEVRFPGRPQPPLVTFQDRLRAAWEKLFVQAWPASAAAVALAVINVTAFAFDHPLGVTGELSAWSSRIFGQFGLLPGRLEGLDQFSGCNLVNAPPGLLTSTFMLDAGLIFGAFAASVMASEFKIRVPRQPIRYAQSAVGGAMMGYGAGISLGCTIGAFFSAIPSLGLNGWLFGLGLLGGAMAGTQVLRRLA